MCICPASYFSVWIIASSSATISSVMSSEPFFIFSSIAHRRLSNLLFIAKYLSKKYTTKSTLYTFGQIRKIY